jgi:hypothetical protein
MQEKLEGVLIKMETKLEKEEEKRRDREAKREILKSLAF